MSGSWVLVGVVAKYMKVMVMEVFVETLFLHTGSGHVFSFGGGQYGQLGCGEVKVSECRMVVSLLHRASSILYPCFVASSFFTLVLPCLV